MISKFYAPIVTETLEDLVSSLAENSSISSKTNTSLSSTTTNNFEWLSDSSSSTNSASNSSSSSTHSSSFDSISLSSRNSESSSDSETQDHEIEDNGSELLDQHRALLQVIEWVYTTRYWVIRQTIIRTSATFDNRLERRHQYPQLFRNSVRMDPHSFDSLVQRLEVAEVFQNRSNYSQMPVARQVYIALKRLGAYENSMALDEVADWAGVGYGTVDLVIRRVITAVFETILRSRHIRWPSGEEKIRAKDWIETMTSPAFRKAGVW